MKNAFELGHVYEVTEFAKTCDNLEIDDHRPKYYICDDVWDFHVYRIVIGYNSEYEKEPRTKLIEQDNINKNCVLQEVEEDLGIDLGVKSIRSFPSNFVIGDEMEDELFKAIIKAIAQLDDGDNFDLREYRYDTDIQKLIDDIDGGYGITVLDADLNVKVKEE